MGTRLHAATEGNIAIFQLDRDGLHVNSVLDQPNKAFQRQTYRTSTSLGNEKHCQKNMLTVPSRNRKHGHEPESVVGHVAVV